MIHYKTRGRQLKIQTDFNQVQVVIGVLGILSPNANHEVSTNFLPVVITVVSWFSPVFSKTQCNRIIQISHNMHPSVKLCTCVWTSARPILMWPLGICGCSWSLIFPWLVFGLYTCNTARYFKKKNDINTICCTYFWHIPAASKSKISLLSKIDTFNWHSHTFYSCVGQYAMLYNSHMFYLLYLCIIEVEQIDEWSHVVCDKTLKTCLTVWGCIKHTDHGCTPRSDKNLA